MAKRTWIMKQEWKNVVFLHWPVKEEWLRRLVPNELEIDLYDNQAWVGVVFFQAEATRLRLLPHVPGTSSFLELNVRTYVKHGKKQGVYFFSLDADSRLAVSAASMGGFLPYRHADMSNTIKSGQCEFFSRRIEFGQYPESFKMTYKPISKLITSNRLEQWLTERYCLWTKPGEQLYRVDIAHSPWLLQYLEGEIFRNTMASYLPISLHRQLPIAHYSMGQKVRFFAPVKEA
ncbi:DUF2071 domain-containing protein [Planococcus sp. CPCC 101016]|uniref:YqjF family protein n=1 Tax=Planococcus sp. CPCC 101016 TaxID=2599617 RepID=UPI0011B4CE33|nr:DUF2071 domain-containing protein [Planococcus sp. CPCC 101016]TWT06720.1 DUF2071 domain-containing protein [Planococcus sp. CPCC 101016]